MPKGIEPDIDALFRLPLDEFTAARNALAKQAGKGGAAIKQLTKPPVAAWAVNQLHWSRRPEYDALIKAAEGMRRTHKAVIEGGRGDLREAGREHEHALDVALKATVALMREAGQPVTDVTRHAILNTLRALPSDEAPGRLTRTLSPGGFEMLAGFKPGKSVKPGKTPAAVREPAQKGKKPEAPKAASAARERAEREAAERALRSAEHEARRAEFDAARTARDASRAEKRLEQAREALQQAREEVDAAEREAAAAARAKESAERKQRNADTALEAARRRVPR